MLYSNKYKVFRLFLLLIISIGLLQACSKKDKVREVEVTKQSALEMYLEAKRALDANVWTAAENKYKDLRAHYPFGHYTEQGYLELAFAQYKLYKMEKAISTVNRFIKNYPAHKNLDYAYYLKGLIYFNSDRGLMQRINPDETADRNQDNIRNAFSTFKDFLDRYPESDYAADAQQRMIYLKNQLASFEIQVASYYLRRGAPIATVNRAKFVLQAYQNTPSAADALALLAAAYEKLEEPELAAESKAMLAANYPGHEYLESGKVNVETDVLKWREIWPF